MQTCAGSSSHHGGVSEARYQAANRAKCESRAPFGPIALGRHSLTTGPAVFQPCGIRATDNGLASGITSSGVGSRRVRMYLVSRLFPCWLSRQTYRVPT